MFNGYAKRAAVLGKKKAAIIASDEYIDKEGEIRCRVCQGCAEPLEGLTMKLSRRVVYAHAK